MQRAARTARPLPLQLGWPEGQPPRSPGWPEHPCSRTACGGGRGGGSHRWRPARLPLVCPPAKRFSTHCSPAGAPHSQPTAHPLPARRPPRPAPQRLEPKIFLASERTFLSWLHMAITLGAIAAALLSFSATAEKQRATGHMVGPGGSGWVWAGLGGSGQAWVGLGGAGRWMGLSEGRSGAGRLGGWVYGLEEEREWCGGVAWVVGWEEAEAEVQGPTRDRCNLGAASACTPAPAGARMRERERQHN